MFLHTSHKSAKIHYPAWFCVIAAANKLQKLGHQKHSQTHPLPRQIHTPRLRVQSTVQRQVSYRITQFPILNDPFNGLSFTCCLHKLLFSTKHNINIHMQLLVRRHPKIRKRCDTTFNTRHLVGHRGIYETLLLSWFLARGLSIQSSTAILSVLSHPHRNPCYVIDESMQCGSVQLKALPIINYFQGNPLNPLGRNRPEWNVGQGVQQSKMSTSEEVAKV